MKRKSEGEDLSGDGDGVRAVCDERRALRLGVPLVAIVLTSAFAAYLLLQRAEPRSPAAAPEGRERVAVDTAPARIRVLAERPEGVAGKTAVRTEKPPVFTRRIATVGVRPKAEAARTSAERERAEHTDKKRSPEINARDYITALRESGETAGLAAFSPPETRPPRSGVIVPADYQLPEGFARHYQTTDDGRQLAPILVVAPGYEIVDDAGDPVALTDDRIVPPEYAPPDLPVQMLDVPSEHDSGEDVR